ncbi:GNAT family N-acetyltransferase [Streptomyces parvus]|uniref:GNAT family N-acetyltransferase n=1 Tax=Streptomyces parvus TaxID=66428 RepID=UPI00123B61EE|nr:GNAT family protein [Streptomyces parvus]KAA6202472.1 GNAT family N-acetyltransferase [Streptomyces parvus]GGS49151.1 N-acetyltransferase [Streptomyces parvus]
MATEQDFSTVPVLESPSVRLVPLDAGHVPGLVEAAREERERFRFTDVPADETRMAAYVERAVTGRAKGEAVPFAVTDPFDGRVLGTTRFCYFEHWKWLPEHRPRPVGVPEAVEIGYTWLTVRAQGTGVNREAKRLLLGFAFEQWRMRRVTFRTDVRNMRSRRALEGLGASLDGVLRNAQAGYDGTVRDTAVYSVLDTEWARIRDRLDARTR